MDVELGGDPARPRPGDRATTRSVSPRRRARGRRLAVERRQAPPGELGEDALVAVRDQGAEVVVGEREPGRVDDAGLDQAQRPPAARSALLAAAPAGATAGPSTATAPRPPRSSARREARGVGVGEQGEARPPSSPGSAISVPAGRRGRRRRPPSTRRAPRAGPAASQPASAAAAAISASIASPGRAAARARRRALALALARGGRLRLRVALGRERRELVDVGEHRLGEQRQGAPVDAARRSRSLETRRHETRAPSR